MFVKNAFAVRAADADRAFADGGKHGIAGRLIKHLAQTGIIRLCLGHGFVCVALDRHLSFFGLGRGRATDQTCKHQGGNRKKANM